MRHSFFEFDVWLESHFDAAKRPREGGPRLAVVVLCSVAYLVFSEPSAGTVQSRFASALAKTDSGFRDVTVRSNRVGPMHQFEFTATVSDGAAAYVLRCDIGVGHGIPHGEPVAAS